METDRAEGVIGITDDGCILVTGRHSCEEWEGAPGCLYPLRECWYCAYADFRRSSAYTLQKSICRNPRRRVALAAHIRHTMSK